ncbi:hypothetical protein G2W53_042932 [Senna tora]|uniref:Uncharacterized protein n=1 Tax=Senna tora TaxID=362788 RepID=A0A834SHU6_9FABA|nr:hypothetical protein G2W53_042932 [Senna tora]
MLCKTGNITSSNDSNMSILALASKPVVGSSKKMIEGLATSSTAIVSAAPVMGH